VAVKTNEFTKADLVVNEKSSEQYFSLFRLGGNYSFSREGRNDMRALATTYITLFLGLLLIGLMLELY